MIGASHERNCRDYGRGPGGGGQIDAAETDKRLKQNRSFFKRG
jgi:hypothetical protein